MEERFWVRHTSVGHLGPFTIEQLRAKVTEIAGLGDGEACRESDDSATWQPVTAVLGMAPPESPAQPEPPESLGSLEVRTRVRSATAYAGFRLLVTILAIAGIVIAIVMNVAGLDAIRTTSDARLAVWAFCGAALQILTIVAVAAALHCLADIADCALRRDRDS